MIVRAMGRVIGEWRYLIISNVQIMPDQVSGLSQWYLWVIVITTSEDHGLIGTVMGTEEH